MIRLFDILFSFVGLLLLSPLLLILIVVGYFNTGFPFFRQQRVGKHKQQFNFVKFRSMHVNDSSLAKHLESSSSITRFGGFFPNFKLDELPQLWNVLVGDMSLVGHRPNLFNKGELIQERESLILYSVRPGITGLAQTKKNDMSTPKLLAETDANMIQKFNFFGYFKFILHIIFGKVIGDRIKN